ncbi:hypothetical protein [Pyxidicoccus xibeiensis]|uniref:hypothetical protein n=1 Tax=Pyxidicoccus xibeiensis TaxID=2906759 RepID=UPI0020A719D6|nr:hypothetical protein [Pyxidicoccus xibeiensis]MCP3138347.1 hypothetical protein [Pyxidicoccus xibeiensis]
MLKYLLRRDSKKGLALVTANFGGLDVVKPLPPRFGIDAFYYTDEATRDATSVEARRTWTRILVPNYPRFDFSPRLRGRYFKHQIHRLDEVRGHRFLVWADASLALHDLDFLREGAKRLAKLPPHKRVLLVPHPDRRTIQEEFDFIESQMSKGDEYLRVRYAEEKMREQMEDFRARGWSLQSPLWCGTIWMMENSELLRSAWDDWWDQNLRFGMMDQLSLHPVLAHRGIEPQPLQINLWNNSHFSWVKHVKLA